MDETPKSESSNALSSLRLPRRYRGESAIESSPSPSIGNGAGLGVANRNAWNRGIPLVTTATYTSTLMYVRGPYAQKKQWEEISQ